MSVCIYTDVCLYTDVYVNIYTMYVYTDMSVRVCGSVCIYIAVCVY